MESGRKPPGDRSQNSGLSCASAATANSTSLRGQITLLMPQIPYGSQPAQPADFADRLSPQLRYSVCGQRVEGGLDCRQVQLGGMPGSRCAVQHPQGATVGEVQEGLPRGRVVLTS